MPTSLPLVLPWRQLVEVDLDEGIRLLSGRQQRLELRSGPAAELVSLPLAFLVVFLVMLMERPQPLHGRFLHERGEPGQLACPHGQHRACLGSWKPPGAHTWLKAMRAL